PVRDRLGSGDPQAARLQWLWPLAAVADPGRVRAPWPGGDPAARAAAGHGAGRGRRLVRPARALRQAHDGAEPGARDRLRARRPSGARGDRLLLGPLGAATVEVAG